MTNESERRPSALLGDWFVSTPESEAMLAEEVEALRQNEKAHTCCACFTHNNLSCCNAGHPRPDWSGAETVQRAWDRSPLLRSVRALRLPPGRETNQ